MVKEDYPALRVVVKKFTLWRDRLVGGINSTDRLFPATRQNNAGIISGNDRTGTKKPDTRFQANG
jgi:hypothetical protein